jgi:hypothetical protein
LHKLDRVLRIAAAEEISSNAWLRGALDGLFLLPPDAIGCLIKKMVAVVVSHDNGLSSVAAS